MEFSDQIELGAQLAEERPEVGQAERAKFRVVLLDEYQDTSVAQALMLYGLFSGPDAGTGRGHPVTAVGDPYQAIYGWRGASVSATSWASATTSRAPTGRRAPDYSLTVNRRSEARILDIANALAGPLYAQLPRCSRSRPAGRPTAGDGPGGVLDDLRRGAGVARRPRCRAAPRAGPAWSDIGVLIRDNKTAAAVFNAPDEAECRSRSSASRGCCGCPRSSRWSRRSR